MADRFAIPFTMATTMGLAAVALSAVPSPSSPVNAPTSSGFIALLPTLSNADISAGLPASVAAATLLGKSGAAALLILLFLAVTSATSAELIAVSSILTYDIYVRYINPQATEEQVLRMSHIGVRRHLPRSDHIAYFRTMVGCSVRTHHGRCRRYLFLHWHFHGLALRQFFPHRLSCDVLTR